MKIGGVQVRGHAEIVSGTVARFICPQGHTQIEDLDRKSLPLPKRIGRIAITMLMRTWGDPNTGVTFVCRSCTRSATAARGKKHGDLQR